MKIINKKIIISIALIIMTLILLTTNVFAINPDDPKWDPNPHMDSGGGFIEKANIVLGWIQFLGILIAVIVLTIIGLKYLFSSVEGKAEYKKTMLPYVIGCFMLVGISAVIEIIESIAKM